MNPVALATIADQHITDLHRAAADARRARTGHRRIRALRRIRLARPEPQPRPVCGTSQ
ncbi:MAG TPA: hypothetical protein VHC49_22105 [Mycobacteriales bacterium]|nr:hypothetical protein [Mycobacteriales bacterium]